MDVGLNNRNTLGEVDPAFTDVVFLVNATSTEKFNLWQEYSKESMSNVQPLSDEIISKLKEELDSNLFDKVLALNKKVDKNKLKRIDWEQISSGFALKIGQIDSRPVCVTFSFAIINEKKICFYEATSQAVCHKMIEDFLIEKFQLTHDNYCRWNHTNADNFHNCVGGLGRRDKEPRDTIYKKY